MDQYFREIFEGMRQAAVEMQAAHGYLVQASQAQQRAGDALTAALTAALHTRDEHEDLRETVHRLEGTVLDLVKEVRELRAGRNGHGKGE